MQRASIFDPETRLAEIVAAMEQRVEPRCSHFGACGGCQLQHLPYPDQLQAKQQMLTEILRAAEQEAVPEVQMKSAHPWHYRNRVRLRVQGAEVGYSRRASNEFLPIHECPIASPLLMRMAMSLRERVVRGQAVWPEGTSALEMFTDADETSVQLSFYLDAQVSDVSREAPAQLRALCVAAQQEFPQLIGAGLLAAAPDRTQSRRVQSTQRVEIARWGSAHLRYRVGGNTYTVTRGGFFQVNRFLTEAMVDAVVDHRAGALVFDLFAGAGLFSVPLSQRFQRVVAVEIGEPAATDLRNHMALSGKEHTAIAMSTQNFLQREHRKPDLVVMDPPRAGVSLPALQALLRLAPPEIVYVSCDAGTFARDCRTLLESGYTLASLQVLDLFPQTFHTETVGVFRR